MIRIGSFVLRVDDLQRQTEFWEAAFGYVRRDSGESDDFVMVGKCFKGLTDELLTWQTKQLLARETGRRGIAVLVRPELVVEIALDGVQSSTRYAGGVALRFARVKRYRPDKNAGEADMIDDLRALLPARAGDEFQASGPSKEVPNRKDENPQEER